MQIWHKEIPFSIPEQMIQKTFSERALFFDIETTGFSSARTFIYLIGCVSRNGEKLMADQFFADNPAEEPEVISAFLSFAEDFDTIITFNGIGFDIPYLTSRCKILNIEEHLSNYTYIDIYRLVSKLKFLLKLPNYRQKSIESFLGIDRTDTFDGGELIEVYQNYVSQPSDESLALLKQHNLEDILNMPQLLKVLSYCCLFEGRFSVISARTDTYTNLYGKPGNPELYIILQNEIPVPCRVSCQYKEFYLTAHKDQTTLNIKLLNGELKFFFENYKDYYYLPAEDMAIHKSVASYVEKEYRKKATASTCYSRKSAVFIPQYEKIATPLFQNHPKDKLTYFELTDSFLESGSQLYTYAAHILDLMANGIPKRRNGCPRSQKNKGL